MEKITKGYTLKKTNEVVGSEPITLSEVKSYMGINFDYHNNRLTSLISSCRKSLEDLKMVTLIDSRDIELTWKEFYGSEYLPYIPISGEVSVTDLDDNDIEYEITGNQIFGDYPDGLKITYSCVGLSVNDNIKDGLIRAVSKCFEKDMNPHQAILSEFNFVEL